MIMAQERFMKTSESDESLLVSRGWSFEYPGFWFHQLVDCGLDATLSDGPEPNDDGTPVWSAQVVGANDTENEGECVAGEDCATLQAAFDFFDRVARGQ